MKLHHVNKYVYCVFSSDQRGAIQNRHIDSKVPSVTEEYHPFTSITRELYCAVHPLPSVHGCFLVCPADKWHILQSICCLEEIL